MTPRSFAWLATLLVSATLSAQFGRAPMPAGRASAPVPVSRSAPSPSPTPSRGLAGRPGRMPTTASIPRPAPGTPSQAVSPLDNPAAVAVGDGGRPPLRPASPTLDTVAADPVEKARALEAAREFRAMKVPAKKVTSAVRKLLKLRWHKSLRDAAYKARADHKPILWIQALGDLKGYT